MSAVWVVGIGGAIGSMLRFLLVGVLPEFILGNFPLQIFVVNIIGCLLMGVVTESMALYFSAPALLMSFLTTGILGGFTTFSAFSLEFSLLIERKLIMWAGIYVIASVGLSLLGFFAGTHLVRMVLK